MNFSIHVFNFCCKLNQIIFNALIYGKYVIIPASAVLLFSNWQNLGTEDVHCMFVYGEGGRGYAFLCVGGDYACFWRVEGGG